MPPPQTLIQGTRPYYIILLCRDSEARPGPTPQNPDTG